MGIKVYPNPFTSKLYFEFNRGTDTNGLIEVFDISGRKLNVVYNKTIKANNDYRIEYRPDKISNNALFYRIQFDDVVKGQVIHQ